MNETIKTLMNRRSIRSYRNEQIKEEELQEVLLAGRYAANGMNKQLWRFVVVQNPQMLQSMSGDINKLFGRGGNPLYSAPTLIAVFVDETALTPMQDGVLAIGNMLNAATSLGVAGCWVNGVAHLLNSPEGAAWRQKLGMPENYLYAGSIILGYNAGEAPTASPRRENVVSYMR